MSEKIEIFDISYDGAGVGKVSGKVCFVPKTLPGEIVQARIVDAGEKFCVGEIEKILKASPSRIEPFCPYFGVCGGCDFQHCTYQTEQALKKQILARELEKAGYFGDIMFVPSPQRFFYRNKVKFEVKNGKLGYFKPKTQDFFEVKTCPIVEQKVLEALPFVEEFLAANNFHFLQNVCLRRMGEKVVICFLFEETAENEIKNVKKTAIFDHFRIFFGFGKILESDKTKLLDVSKIVQTAKGRGEKVVCEQGGKPNDIRTFAQVNDQIAQQLYGQILQMVACKKVVNAYSGQGLLTAQMAEKAAFVFGIEMQKSAHKIAEKACFGRKNVKNICGRVEKELAKIDLSGIDLVVLDPARAGCQNSVLQAINSQKIPEIAYISCNFATLVRDLKILKEKYEIESVTIFDMFPCTANMETLVILQSKP